MGLPALLTPPNFHEGIEEPELVHRPSNAAFYEERPENTIFSETSKE